jgi:anhydro-N-acetylmuramic acid kinase
MRVIGLMSGTSMDGVDVAVLETDGDDRVLSGPCLGVPYPTGLRAALLRLGPDDPAVPHLEKEVTDLQSQAVRAFCSAQRIELATLDGIGFHGQTIRHEPQRGRTWQLGDGQRMATALGIRVVNNFRQNDMDHGGQGAPLVPAYHRALVRSQRIAEPVAVLNIGGVSNVTLVDGDLLFACDCGPGNALIDDWVSARCDVPFDDGGEIAAAGSIDEHALTVLLESPYFRRVGPKSLDRNAFSLDAVANLSPRDGAATLAAFTAAAVALEAERLPCRPKTWIVVGGGRLNRYLLAQLRSRLGAVVLTAEEFGWAGGAIEAQAFAYLAVRSLRGLPLTWPGTTGVSEPVSGGVCWNPVPFPETRAVLFDLDGTLLDTAPDMAAALNALRREEGLEPLALADIRPLVSNGSTGLLRLSFPQVAGAPFEALRERFLDIYRASLAAGTQLFAGMEAVLQRLEANHIAWGIVTNKPGWLTEPLLEKLSLRQRAGVVVSGDTLLARKPDPAPLLHAATELGLSPAECIYIGDAERDVLAARAAGMRVYVAMFGYIPAQERPREWPATGWLEGPEAVAQLIDALPPRT